MTSINKIQKMQKVTLATGLYVNAGSAEMQLHRLVLANMLWEDNFYLDGKTIADTIKDLVSKCIPENVALLALSARNIHNLRHVPLLVCRELARVGKLKAQTLTDVIQRPDEISEFLAIYWMDGKTPLSNQVKKGIGEAFKKFTPYQLAKWDKNSAKITLRDAMFMTRPKPINAAQAEMFKQLADQTLPTPDTWETNLSAGADKCETFTRLMDENKLGALAFIRNLRNMLESGVSLQKILEYGSKVNTDKVLPFRYFAARNAASNSSVQAMLQDMMLRTVKDMDKLPGRTVLLVDVSGSMDTKISDKSDLTRAQAAAALAVLCAEISEKVDVFTFSQYAVRVSTTLRGFALEEAIARSQPHHNTYLGKAIATVNTHVPQYDRLIVFTDEQSHDRPVAPNGRGYIINVAANRYGINHNNYVEINGFSENLIKYVQAYEQLG